MAILTGYVLIFYLFAGPQAGASVALLESIHVQTTGWLSELRLMPRQTAIYGRINGSRSKTGRTADILWTYEYGENILARRLCRTGGWTVPINVPRSCRPGWWEAPRLFYTTKSFFLAGPAPCAIYTSKHVQLWLSFWHARSNTISLLAHNRCLELKQGLGGATP